MKIKPEKGYSKTIYVMTSKKLNIFKYCTIKLKCMVTVTALWRSQVFTIERVMRGVWGRSLSRRMLGVKPRVWSGGKEVKSSALGDFCNFSIKTTHFMHISAKIVNLKQ